MPSPGHCWCGDPKMPGYALCNRHVYAERMFAETGVNNWDKPKKKAS